MGELGLAYDELLLDDRHARLGAVLGVTPFALLGLEAAHNRNGLIGLVFGHQRGKQRLALLRSVGKAPGLVLVEASLDELRHKGVGAALQDLDVTLPEAFVAESLHRLPGDCLVVEGADDYRVGGHSSISI